MIEDLIFKENIRLTKSCSGFCVICGKDHVIAEGPARQYCLELMKVLEDKKRIDLLASNEESDPRFSTGYLFGNARGQMFGGMVCRQPDGSVVFLRAFSGQYNGVWEVPGWVPPVFAVRELENISSEVEKAIKKLSKQIDLLNSDSSKKNKLIYARKSLSRKLMKDIHFLYNLTNFRGERRSLGEVFLGANGMPTGIGDCCAPKLLNYAAINGLIPLGLAEFYWGKENKSGRRVHGRFYASCEEKCRPILGFMLCGLGVMNDS